MKIFQSAVNSIQTSEKEERLLYRAMDRSDVQLIRKTIMMMVLLKRPKLGNILIIIKAKAKHSELCRINAINRQLAINEDANHLRSLGI